MVIFRERKGGSVTILVTGNMSPIRVYEIVCVNVCVCMSVCIYTCVRVTLHVCDVELGLGHCRVCDWLMLMSRS